MEGCLTCAMSCSCSPPSDKTRQLLLPLLPSGRYHEFSYLLPLHSTCTLHRVDDDTGGVSPQPTANTTDQSVRSPPVLPAAFACGVCCAIPSSDSSRSMCLPYSFPSATGTCIDDEGCGGGGSGGGGGGGDELDFVDSRKRKRSSESYPPPPRWHNAGSLSTLRTKG